MIVDSGATSHFVRTSDKLPRIGPSIKIVNLPNGNTIQALHKVRLPFTKLTEKAREAHVLPDLKLHSLISVPKLSDKGYINLFMDGQKGVVLYKANDITFTATNKPVLQGWCRDISGLWILTSNKHEPKVQSSNSTMCMTYHRQKLRSDFCTRQQGSQSKQHGSLQSKMDTTTHGRISLQN